MLIRASGMCICWKELFCRLRHKKKKSIPLCLIPQEDTLIWPKTKDGQYSVKLGYQLLCAKELSGSTSGSSNKVNQRMWSGLWRLKVPNKVKTFAWQACSESLPTMVNLARRRVVLSNSCTSCNRGLETVIHALWGCEKVKGSGVLTLMSCGVQRIKIYFLLIFSGWRCRIPVELKVSS